MRRIPAVHTRGGNTTASRRCVSGAYVRWRGSHRAWRRAPSSLRSSSRARGGSDAPGETRRFTHGSIDDDDEHMDGMDDDPSRELEDDDDDDDESDDREAFKREQDLSYSMTAIRQKPLSIRASPAVNREETLERWDPDADNTSGSSSDDGGFQMNRRRRLSGRAGRDPAFLPARDETSGGKSSLLRPVFGKEELDEVIALAIPALGSLLADPLMSLVDTAVVGRYSSTSLAALGPSMAVFQIVFQVRSSFIFIIRAIRVTSCFVYSSFRFSASRPPGWWRGRAPAGTTPPCAVHWRTAPSWPSRSAV
jgi:hypothetical protein